MTGDRLLVLGASGQLGADLVRHAAADDRYQVTSFTREDLDLTRTDEIGPALDDVPFDLLVNCAAWTAVDEAESHATEAVALNAHAVGAVAAACRRKGARLITVSTDYVFDGETDRPYAEDARPAPLNVYGASKLMGESLARTEWLAGTTVVRTASLFGTGGGGPDRPAVNFVNTMIGAAQEGRSLKVVDDVTMSPTWTGHLAPSLLALIESDAPAGVYHLTAQGEATWYDLARAALEGAGVETELRATGSAGYPTPARRPRYSVLDTGRAASFGVRLPPWRDGLAGYLRARYLEPAEGK